MGKKSARKKRFIFYGCQFHDIHNKKYWAYPALWCAFELCPDLVQPISVFSLPKFSFYRYPFPVLPLSPLFFFPDLFLVFFSYFFWPPQKQYPCPRGLNHIVFVFQIYKKLFLKHCFLTCHAWRHKKDFESWCSSCIHGLVIRVSHK